MRPSKTGIVKDGTIAAELRVKTEMPNDAGFICSSQR